MPMPGPPGLPAGPRSPSLSPDVHDQPRSPAPRMQDRSPTRTFRVGAVSPARSPARSPAPSPASPTPDAQLPAASPSASPATPVAAFLNHTFDLGTRLAVLSYEVVRLKRVRDDITQAIENTEQEVIQITAQLLGQGQGQGQEQGQQGQEQGHEQGQGQGSGQGQQGQDLALAAPARARSRSPRR